MIRELEKNEIEDIMNIWEKSTIEAHKFISEDYWIRNHAVVKEKYIPQSKTFIYEKNKEVKAFISVINKGFIGALFVDVGCQGQGIGTKLINFTKGIYNELSLAVYKENKKSVKFYKKVGFTIEKEQINEDTGEKELIMTWSIN